MECLSKLKNALAAKEEAAQAAYRNIVTRIANGEDVRADAVQTVLRDVGKSVDDLEKAVALHTRRKELRATFDKTPALTEQQNAIQQQIAEAERVLEAAQKIFDDTIAPLIAEKSQISEQLIEADRAKTELRRSCPREDLAARLAEIQYQLEKIVATNEEHTRESERFLAHAKECGMLINESRERKSELVNRYTADQARARQLADEHLAAVKASQAEIEKLHVERSQILAAQLEP